MTETTRFAPGWPGIEPRWTTSAKSAIGTLSGDGARVWFTASHGILNEIYYPEVDTACTRDAGFLVSGPDGFFSEEKRHTTHSVEWLAPGVPAFRFFNACTDGRYTIEKRICCSSDFDVVLQQVRFIPHVGALEDYHLTFLVSPHLGNQGSGNTAWTGDFKGTPMLFASRDALAMAVASSAPWSARSVAFAGPGDAWHEAQRDGRISSAYERAENGNVTLAGEIDLAACRGLFTIAIAFGADASTAALHARATLLPTYDHQERRYASVWRSFQSQLLPLDEAASASEPHLYRTSAAVIKAHASMNIDGGMIASLSIPWGQSKGDHDLGGYHLVWPRDMVSSAGGLLAAGAHDEVRAAIRYLAAVQEADGHWSQNMWLNGTPYWHGIQLDETAFPILLVDLARRANVLDANDVARWWPMVRRAAAFIVRNGPATQQDRWEEDAGFSPFTLAVAIAALLAAAELSELHGDIPAARYFRDTADMWNASIERWTWAEDTELAARHGVRGYYVRIGNSDDGSAHDPVRGTIIIKNRTQTFSIRAAHEVVATDALALVRFGLRSAHDPRIRDTVTVIDAMLRTDTTTGPTWHRYNGDGYGEHEDGTPFDGTGVGRGWPLLAGERAHYELAAGNRAEAERLAAVMRAQANEGGMLPEQIWDSDDIPAHDLFNGRPSGAAMPLVWAHAEYVKLVRSLHDGHVFDCPPQTLARYVHDPQHLAAHASPIATSVPWRLNLPVPHVIVGQTLRIELHEAATVRWSDDEWRTVHDADAIDSTVGVHFVDLPAETHAAGGALEFTVRWTHNGEWTGENYHVPVVPG
jgi:glucoamylase